MKELPGLSFIILFIELASSQVNLRFDQNSYEQCSVDLLDSTKDNSGSGSQLIQSLIHFNPQHLLWTVRTVEIESNLTSIKLYNPYKYKEKCSINIVIQRALAFNEPELGFPATRYSNPKSIFIFIILQLEIVIESYFKNKLPLFLQAKVFIIALDLESRISSLYIPSFFSSMEDFQFTKVLDSKSYSYSDNLKYLEK